MRRTGPQRPAEVAPGPEKSWSSHPVGCKAIGGLYSGKCHNPTSIFKSSLWLLGKNCGGGSVRRRYGYKAITYCRPTCPMQKSRDTQECLDLN